MVFNKAKIILRIIEESSLWIKKIKKATKKSLEKLALINERLDENLYLCETLEEINNLNSRNFIESLLKLSAEDAAKLKPFDDLVRINNSNLEEKIENLFVVIEMRSLFDIYNYWPKIIKYFKGKDLFAVDIISQKVTSQNINKNWQWWDPTCLLEDGFVFCSIQSEAFIIAPDNSITTLNSSQYSARSGLIAIDDFVYMIGGYANNSFKFSLKSKIWTTIAAYPVLNSNCISCAFFNGIILIGCFSSHIIYTYNISNNSYTQVSIALNINTGKNCLATINKAYIIEHTKNYYESGVNDINLWNSIGSANMFADGNARYSYSLLYEDSFYFITTDLRLIQFNLKNKKLQHIKTL